MERKLKYYGKNSDNVGIQKRLRTGAGVSQELGQSPWVSSSHSAEALALPPPIPCGVYPGTASDTWENPLAIL